MLESVEYSAGSPSDDSEDKKRIVKNLYLSNIAEEFAHNIVGIPNYLLNSNIINDDCICTYSSIYDWI